MMASPAVFNICLTLRSPFLFQGLGAGQIGVDSALIRGECGRPIIPADQVRGVLRAALEALVSVATRTGRETSVIDAKDILSLFGEKSSQESVEVGGNAEQDKPRRGRLHFSDLVAEREYDADQVTRIEVDNELGSAKGGALQVIELAAPIGADVSFRGPVYYFSDSELPEDKIHSALKKALGLIPAIGAFKSAGFGEVVESEIAAVAPSRHFEVRGLAGTLRSNAKVERHAFRITFDRPILVNAERRTDNLFVGSDIIPGAALKGALAERLRLAGHDLAAGDLAQNFTALRISHAFPENADGIPFGFRLPSSLIAAEHGDAFRFGDALLCDCEQPSDEGGYVFGNREDPVLALFPVDWKWQAFHAFSEGGNRFPVTEIPPELPRTHAAIHPEEQIALDQQLFSTVAKGVLRHGDPAAPRAWRFVIDGGKVQESESKFFRECLQDGLGPIGRTGAFAEISEVDPDNDAKGKFNAVRLASPPDIAACKPGLFAVTVVTPALMLDPRSTTPEHEQYRDYWRNACDAKMLNCFTTRSLAGGHIAIRYRLYGETYYPFVLTDPGSVFLLKNPDEDRLAEIIRFGLKPPAFSDGKGGSIVPNWRNCPFLPENGFGELVCNLVDHVALSHEVIRV